MIYESKKYNISNVIAHREKVCRNMQFVYYGEY